MPNTSPLNPFDPDVGSFERPKTMLGRQQPGGQCAHIGFEPRVFAKGMKTKDATVNWNTCIRLDLEGLGTHYSFTFRSSHRNEHNTGPTRLL